MAEFWKKYWRWIIGIGLVYLYPFYCLLIGMIPGVDWPALLTFGLELKDFITVWIALGGVIAVVVGIFQTQSRITQQEKQFKEQTELQQKQQRDARFASGIELLGNPNESTRIGGAYSLYYLARDFAEYLTPVCEILCAHLRTIANKDKFQFSKHQINYPANEVATIIGLLFSKKEPNKNKNIFYDEYKIIKGVFLCEDASRPLFYNQHIQDTDFSQSHIINMNFSCAIMNNVLFADSELENVKFVEVTFEGYIIFRGAKFIAGVKFISANNLTNGTPSTIFVNTILETCGWEQIINTTEWPKPPHEETVFEKLSHP